MTEKEFNLSENIYADGTRLLVEDVKEFIKILVEEDFRTAIKKFEESINKNCSKGDGCYICESCKTQLKKRLIYYLKRRAGEKLKCQKKLKKKSINF